MKNPVLLFGLVLALVPVTFGQPPGEKKPPKSFLNFADARPALGAPAPDFSLLDLDGREFRLRDLRGRRPVVIEFGSYT